MSLDSGSIPIIQYRVDLASNNAPGSGSAAFQITAGTPNIRSMTLTNTSSSSVSIYHGSDATRKCICIIPPTTTIQRVPLPFGVNNRLSVGATGTSAITSGEVILNCWS